MFKKISVEELKPGMVVVKMSSEVWEHLPYLYDTPGTIDSAEQVAAIVEQGYRQVFIETGEDRKALENRLNTLLTKNHKHPQRKRTPFHQEMEIAWFAYENAMAHAKRIINDAKLGRQVDFEASTKTMASIVDSVIRNPNTLVCLAKLMGYDDYTYRHCINVATISVVFGEYLGMSREELNLLGVAGLVHDLGKMAVPERITNKRGRLTTAEFDEMKRHPLYGLKLLTKQGNVPDIITRAVRDHHEKYNGSGYPTGLSHKDIPPFARIVSLADVYDALTSDRSYKDAILPNKALAIMYGMRGQDFDPEEIELFIKCLGIFPAGSLVKLNTGAYGVVYETNPELPLLPKIRVILDEDLRPIPMTMVDMAAQQAANNGGLQILECADPAKYRLNLKPFLTRKT